MLITQKNTYKIQKLFTTYKLDFFEINTVFFCAILSIGLATGEALMSIGTIGLVINWLVEGNFTQKLELIKKRNYMPLLVLSSFFILLLGLFNTTNFDYAIHDLKIKLPLLFLPLVIGTITIKKKYVRFIFILFVSAVLFSTLVSYLVFLKIIPIQKSLDDVRNISVFISHIRLSLLICMAIVLLSYSFFRIKSIALKISLLLLVIWFVYFLTVLQAVTGLVILLIIIAITIFKLFIRSNRMIRYLLYALVIGFGYYSYWTVKTIYQNNFIATPIDVLTLDEKTEGGEIYQHKLEEDWVENGNRVWYYIAPIELNEAWRERSEMKLDSLDLSNQPLWGTLYRYLASKGFRKDRKGVEALSDKEIREIEKGKTNCCEKTSGLNKRIKETLYELIAYKKNQDPNGHSMIQRLIYLKTSVLIIKNNFLFGVGIGDVNDAFVKKHKEINTQLRGDNRKRVHNQFFSIFVALGLFGFSFWLFTLLFPYFHTSKSSLYSYFLIIILFSFLTDNTLERQAGVMFFSFFNSLLLFQVVKSSKHPK